MGQHAVAERGREHRHLDELDERVEVHRLGLRQDQLAVRGAVGDEAAWLAAYDPRRACRRAWITIHPVGTRRTAGDAR